MYRFLYCRTLQEAINTVKGLLDETHINSRCGPYFALRLNEELSRRGITSSNWLTLSSATFHFYLKTDFNLTPVDGVSMQFDDYDETKWKCLVNYIFEENPLFCVTVTPSLQTMCSSFRSVVQEIVRCGHHIPTPAYRSSMRVDVRAPEIARLRGETLDEHVHWRNDDTELEWVEKVLASLDQKEKSRNPLVQKCLADKILYDYTRYLRCFEPSDPFVQYLSETLEANLLVDLSNVVLLLRPIDSVIKKIADLSSLNEDEAMADKISIIDETTLYANRIFELHQLEEELHSYSGELQNELPAEDVEIVSGPLEFRLSFTVGMVTVDCGGILSKLSEKMNKLVKELWSSLQNSFRYHHVRLSQDFEEVFNLFCHAPEDAAALSKMDRHIAECTEETLPKLKQRLWEGGMMMKLLLGRPDSFKKLLPAIENESVIAEYIQETFAVNYEHLLPRFQAQKWEENAEDMIARSREYCHQKRKNLKSRNIKKKKEALTELDQLLRKVQKFAADATVAPAQANAKTDELLKVRDLLFVLFSNGFYFCLLFLQEFFDLRNTCTSINEEEKLLGMSMTRFQTLSLIQSLIDPLQECWNLISNGFKKISRWYQTQLQYVKPAEVKHEAISLYRKLSAVRMKVENLSSRASLQTLECMQKLNKVFDDYPLLELLSDPTVERRDWKTISNRMGMSFFNDPSSTWSDYATMDWSQYQPIWASVLSKTRRRMKAEDVLREIDYLWNRKHVKLSNFSNNITQSTFNVLDESSMKSVRDLADQSLVKLHQAGVSAEKSKYGSKNTNYLRFTRYVIRCVDRALRLQNIFLEGQGECRI